MGSYDIGCAVSGLTIGYQDEAYLVPLLPENLQVLRGKPFTFTEHTQNGRGHHKPTGHLTYIDDVFQPMLPILGTYNTYGSLEAIEENDYTRFLEASFGISIHDLAKIISTGTKFGDRRRREIFDKAASFGDGPKQGYNFLKKVSAMFVHKDIYETLAKKGAEPTQWGYGEKFTLPEAYDRLHHKLLDYDERCKANDSDLLLRSQDPLTGLDPQMETIHLGNLISHKWYSFRAVIRDFVKEGLLKNELCEFFEFDSSLTLCNRVYFPGSSAGQSNEDTVTMDLHLAALKVIGKKVAQIAEENIVEKEVCRFCNESKDTYLEKSCRECHLQYCGW